MRFQSPLSNLCDVLIQIQDSANPYESTLTANEAATRAVLVDPVLRALGWDTANTNMVEVEKTLDQMRPKIKTSEVSLTSDVFYLRLSFPSNLPL
jgi:hypothetical protein